MNGYNFGSSIHHSKGCKQQGNLNCKEAQLF